MLSRVADSLYWMSRYLERAENTVRQLDVTMSLLLDTSDTSAETRWGHLLTSLGNPEGVEWNGDLDAMARMLIFDGTHHASVTTCLNAARENARQVREEISTFNIENHLTGGFFGDHPYNFFGEVQSDPATLVFRLNYFQTTLLSREAIFS